MSTVEAQNSASDLGSRFAIGVVLVAVAIFAISSPGYVHEVWGQWLFRAVVLAGASVMLLEWADMHKVPRRWGWAGAVLLAVLLLGIAELLYAAGEMDVVEGGSGQLFAVITPESFTRGWGGVAAAMLLAVMLGLLARRRTMVGGFLYIAIPAFMLVVLEWLDFEIVLWVMLVTWATDIFAYFAGRSIGGPKLAPRISPNKTWAGLIGGMAGAALVGYLAAAYSELGAPFLQIGALMGLLAQGGDLYESWMKRRAGVKDSGTILPGHGGVLDRLNGLLPVVVATYLLGAFGLWAG